MVIFGYGQDDNNNDEEGDDAIVDTNSSDDGEGSRDDNGSGKGDIVDLGPMTRMEYDSKESLITATVIMRSTDLCCVRGFILIVVINVHSNYCELVLDRVGGSIPTYYNRFSMLATIRGRCRFLEGKPHDRYEE
ncbi:hypothetical protein OROHE_019330 [Orobanche hederae]